LPNYRCEYENFDDTGCCTVNSECQQLSETNLCVSRTCNQLTNQCLPKLEPGTLCGQFSAECPPPNSPLSYYEVSLSSLYECQLRSVFPLPPSLPVSGVVPSVSQLSLIPECLWASCSSSNRNRLQIKQRFTVDRTVQNGPLYDADVLIFVRSSNGQNATRSVTFVNVRYSVSSPQYENSDGTRQRAFDDSSVIVEAIPSSGAISTYRLRVLPLGTLNVWPDEVVEITFDVLVAPTPGLSAVFLSTQVIGFDTCTGPYDGTFNAQGASCSSTTFGQRFHTFQFPVSAEVRVGFGSGESCPSLCTGPAPIPPPPTFTLPFPTTAPTSATIPPPTSPPPTFSSGFVGGLLFIDSNGDSRFSTLDGDQRLGNFRVNVHLASTGAITLATRTDSFGVYQFNRTLLFTAAALNPTAANVYIGVIAPSGRVRSPSLAPGDVLASSFVTDTLTENGARSPASFGPALPVDVPPMSVGFRDPRATCVASSAPIVGNTNFTLTVVSVACDGCLLSSIDAESSSSAEDDDDPAETLIGGDECAQKCLETRDAVYRRVQYEYRLNNNRGSTRPVPAASVIAELEPVPGTKMLCVRPVLQSASSNLELLNVRPSHNPHNAARISLAHGIIEPGTQESFQVYYSVCFAPESPQLINATVTAQTDRCVRRLTDWRTCAEPPIDINDCRGTLPGDLETCSGCSIVDVAAKTRLDTKLIASARFEREPSPCVSNRRIATFGCRDDSNITAECLESGAARSVVIGEVRLLESSTIDASEPGTLRIVLKRNAELLNVCTRSTGAQISISAFNLDGDEIDAPARILNTEAADNHVKMDVAFTALPSGSVLIINLMTLVCVPASRIVNYTLTVDLMTERCESQIFCGAQAEFTGTPLATMPTRTCFDPAAFSSFALLEDARKGSVRRPTIVAAPSAGTSAFFWIILVLFGLCVVCLLGWVILRRNGRRLRRKATL
jgi:hypothetical protein